MNLEGLRLDLTPMIFPEFTVGSNSGVGYLANERAAQACFYFYIIAERQRMEAAKPIEKQVVLEGEHWNYTHYEQQRRTVAILYGIEPGDMDNHWPAVRMVALTLGWPAPHNDYVRRVN